jgi:hypothetical protein
MDGSTVGDPVAARTQWTPLVPGGANFATHRLVQIDGTRAEMKKSFGSFLFGGVFLVAGLSMTVIGALGVGWWLTLFGVPFWLVGLYVLWPRALVFDSSTRQFTAGAKSVPFSSIHALQIIKERVSSSDADYWSYELNLVLTDASRINVVDHGDVALIRTHALKLSALIGCRVWDVGTTH